MNIYKVTVSYLEPTTIQGMVLANTPDEARDKFKDATAFDDAPPELNAQIESVELVEENIDPTISSMDEYFESTQTRTLN